MGNTASRAKYDSMLENQKAGGAPPDLDPYEVFGLRKNFTWDELRDAYRQRAKLVHPDKGGSEALFQAVTDCFRKLAQEFRARNADRPHHELKQESARFAEAQRTAAPPPLSGRDRTEFNAKFNAMFEKNRLEDEDDAHGYGSMMEASSKTREDIAPVAGLKPLKATDAGFRDRFHSAFDEATLPAGTAVAKYVEPEVLALSRQLAYTEIGGGRPSEYTLSTMDTKGRGMTYTDFKSAYTNTRLVDPRAVKERRAYRNVDEFINERDARTEAALTEEELAYQAAKAAEEEAREEARLQRTKAMDARYEEHFNRVSAMMLR